MTELALVGPDNDVPAPRTCPVPHGPAAWRGPAPVDPDAAIDFLTQFHTETTPAETLPGRIAQVRREIDDTGTYDAHPRRAHLRRARGLAQREPLHRPALLAQPGGAATAAGPDRGRDLPAECVDHLQPRGARNGGAIRPVITIFAPASPASRAPGSGTSSSSGTPATGRRTAAVLGDPRYVEFTDRACTGLGWRGKGEAVRRAAAGRSRRRHDGVRLFDLPERAVLEVPLRHPEYPGSPSSACAGTRCPAISNMRLSIGGVNYPLAPFNGWYMGTEIGARNLADADRYDLLPVVAERLGLDTSRERTLWRDRALVELNRAVLHSFEQAGVTITDHHTESRRFLTHLRQRGAGRAARCRPTGAGSCRRCPAALTPVFHRYYDEPDPATRPAYLPPTA